MLKSVSITPPFFRFDRFVNFELDKTTYMSYLVRSKICN